MLTFGPKVVTPVLLFAVLSPSLPALIPKNKIGSPGNLVATFIYSFIYLAVYYLLATKLMGLYITPVDLGVTLVMYLLLSLRGVDTVTVITNSVFFMVTFAFLRKQFPRFY